ncbi:Flp pilus assembly complex ATPase component TadA [Candidatus Woesearchaeota archaeon]|nr:Flp pilus assembly complex ATPase component TadA [Candidatus Woesearchaeota archaeon]
MAEAVSLEKAAHEQVKPQIQLTPQQVGQGLQPSQPTITAGEQGAQVGSSRLSSPAEAGLAPEFFIDLRPRFVKLPDISVKEKINVRYPLLPPYAFAHIYWDNTAKELLYSVEEVLLTDTEKELLKLIQLGLEEMINISYAYASKSELIIKYLEKNVQSILAELGAKVSRQAYLKIMYYVYRDFVGMNEIEPMMHDFYIEDIECNGVDTPIYIVHRRYQNMRTNIAFPEMKRLVDFVEKLAQKTGRYVSYAKPLLDGSLPDGSLDFNEQVVYKKDGVVKVGKIGEVVDSYYGSGDGPVAVSKLEVPCFGKDLKISWKPVSYVYRHRLKPGEKLPRLKLETGREVTLTAAHSLFALTREGVATRKTSELKEGDYVAVPLKIPDQPSVAEINVAAELAKTPYSGELVLDNVPSAVYEENKGQIRAYLAENYKHPYEAYYELRQKRILPLKLYSLLQEESLRKCTVRPTSAVGIPAFLKVDKALARLLGYYVAEGWYSDTSNAYYLWFALNRKETHIVEEIRQTMKGHFNLDIHIEPDGKNGVKVKVNSYALWILCKEVLRLAKGARNKAVPEIMFNVGRELQEEFLKAWWEGDYGYTVSDKLISDVAYLALFTDKVISFQRRTKTAKFDGVREVTSDVNYTQRLLTKKLEYPYMVPVEVFNPFKETHLRLRNKRISRARLLEILSDKRYERFANLTLAPHKFLNEWGKRSFIADNELTEKGKLLLNEIKVMKGLIGGDLGFVKIKQIEEVGSSAEYVYDFSVEGDENFIGGAGGICCHNSRVNATYTSDVTAHGPTFTIRKFTKDPLTPVHLLGYKTASPDIFGFLWLAIENKFNIMAIGETASGKTTFLNSILQFVPPEARIVSIEDTRELNLAHENWIPAVGRVGFGIPNLLGKQYGEISLFDLLRETFRQNPDYVVVGEVRGKETYVLFQGMASGHPSFSTFHASSVETLIRRLETPPINLPASLVDSLDIVCSVMHVKDQRRNIRRVKDVKEIIEVKQQVGTVDSNTLFEWNQIEDTFVFNGNSHIMSIISKRTGAAIRELEEEMRVRGLLLSKLLEKNMTHYRDVTRVVNEYYKDPEGVKAFFGIK